MQLCRAKATAPLASSASESRLQQCAPNCRWRVQSRGIPFAVRASVEGPIPLNTNREKSQP